MEGERDAKRIKPLASRGYGSIPHLVGSRRGPADKGVNEGQHDILTKKCRRGDYVVVQEKLDGSNVSVVKHEGRVMPLGRAGYPAHTSRFYQHRVFAAWVARNQAMFQWLPEGWRVCGEWLFQAHGTVYRTLRWPFAAFDVIDAGNRRLTYDRFLQTLRTEAGWPDDFARPHLLHSGAAAVGIEEMMARVDEYSRGRGEPELPEGIVYRCECDGGVEFLAKFVRPEKVDGCHLPQSSGKAPIYHFTLPELGLAEDEIVGGSEDLPQDG